MLTVTLRAALSPSLAPTTTISDRQTTAFVEDEHMLDSPIFPLRDVGADGGGELDCMCVTEDTIHSDHLSGTDSAVPSVGEYLLVAASCLYNLILLDGH